jgi:predicted amidophosphoribosyltransferase
MRDDKVLIEEVVSPARLRLMVDILALGHSLFEDQGVVCDACHKQPATIEHGIPCCDDCCIGCMTHEATEELADTAEHWRDRLVVRYGEQMRSWERRASRANTP